MTITDATNITAKTRWGGWRLNRETYVIEWLSPLGQWYEVDLERCLDSAQVLDWIAQMDGKQWLDERGYLGMIRALDDILHFQANLCSWGTNRALTEAEVRELVEKWF